MSAFGCQNSLANEGESETKGVGSMQMYRANIHTHRDRDGKTALILACFMGATGQYRLPGLVCCRA